MVWVNIEYTVGNSIVYVLYTEKGGKKQIEFAFPLGYTTDLVKPSVIDGKVLIRITKEGNDVFLVPPEFIDDRLIVVDSPKLVESVVRYLKNVSKDNNVVGRLIRELLNELDIAGDTVSDEGDEDD